MVKGQGGAKRICTTATEPTFSNHTHHSTAKVIADRRNREVIREVKVALLLSCSSAVFPSVGRLRYYAPIPIA